GIRDATVNRVQTCALPIFLLLRSDNDNKYSFPTLLTQVIMIVHVDPDNNSVYMVSIPRDSWVYVPLNGGMHKIDQAFLFGAAQQIGRASCRTRVWVSECSA